MAFLPYEGEPDVARLIGAFRGEKTDRVPNFEVLIDDQHVTHMLGRYAGNTLAVGGDPAKGAGAPAGRPMHAKDYIEVCNIIGQDAIIVEALWTPFKKEKEDGTIGIIADRSIKTLKDFHKKVILPDEKDIEAKMVYVREYVEAVKGTKIGVTVLVAAYFQTLYEFVVGLTDFMMMTYEERDTVEEMLEVSAEYWEKFVAAAVAEGIDFVYFADDFAFKTGLFLPPKLFEELWKERSARILAPALEKGLPVLFHSDGRIDDAIPMLLDIGVDCISPLDPYGIDYREYKKKWGDKVCLHGNIDIEFPLSKGMPEDVRQDVIAHMEVLKPGGRYVCGSSHSIVNYIPFENFEAMINTIHEYARY